MTCDYPPMNGGVARYLADLVRASDGAMRVIVPLEHQDPGETVVRRRFFGSGLVRWWPLVVLMRGLGREQDARVLISHVLPIGTAAWIASFVGGPAYTVLFHGLDLALSQRAWSKRWITKQIVRRARAVCVNSEFVARACKELFPDVDPLLLTPGYVPRILPSREEARSALGIGSEEIILLNVARLVPRKGLDRLIEVLPDLPPYVRAVSIGDGKDRARVEALAKHFDARIQFLGAIDDASRDTWYAAADLFVFPVRAEGDDVEGYGIACLEAAAAGLPVIVGAHGGAPETVIEGETGLVVDTGVEGALRDALRRLIADPELRARMGQRGRERVLAHASWSDRWKILTHL